SVIEIAPLAYMRGRTLNDSFIILDEAQNTTVEQMKMFLTRIGFNSKAVITGDPSQIDLPHNVRSGLKNAIEVLEGTEEIGFTFFASDDVVRHPVVAAIVNAYEAFEKIHGDTSVYHPHPKRQEPDAALDGGAKAGGPGDEG
ncbi:MAG: PhoH family protein, partial [Succinivibrio sp.]